MAQGSVANVFYGPGSEDFASIPFSGGGPLTNVWTPCFAGNGASLEVHFLDRNGQTLLIQTYTLSATAVGAFGLTRTGGNVLSDRPKQAVGYLAYARVAAVTIGRMGTKDPQQSGNYVLAGAALPDNLAIGQEFAWCMVADSHGWDFRSGGTESMATTPADALSQDAINPANWLRGTPADITDNSNHTVIAAQVAGVRIYVSGLVVTCNHATQGTVVKITDGNGGTTLYRGFAAANGGGFVCTDMDRTSAATALVAICETNGSSIQITAHGFASGN